MSSRIYSGGQVESTPIAWRATGQQPPAKGAVVRTGPAAAGADVEARIQAAFQKGQAAGEAAGAQRATQQVTQILQQFSAIVKELSQGRGKARAEAEESMVQLSIAIARRVLHREIATDPNAILGLVRSACDRINARETHRLRLAPAAVEVVKQNRAALALPDSVEILADPALPSGGAIFETARGELDASAQTQLDEIQRGLADIVSKTQHART